MSEAAAPATADSSPHHEESASIASPATPEEIIEMAAYFGIDCSKEFYLLPIAKLAVEATLPHGWREEHDAENNRSIFLDPTGQVFENHPQDNEFKSRV
jgi:hypothetical protein